MKTWSTVFAVMLALVLCVSAAEAAKGSKAAKGPKPLRGKITKVDGASVTITSKDGTETTVTTTDATEVTINGEKKTVADLPTGKPARVILDADGKTATAIMVGKAKRAEAPTTQDNK
ncbi:MAG: hypothetical protein ACTHN5_02770 [Phycisphaerae bacterium]